MGHSDAQAIVGTFHLGHEDYMTDFSKLLGKQETLQDQLLIARVFSEFYADLHRQLAREATTREK